MISRQAFKQALKLRWSHVLQVLIQSWLHIWRIVSELLTCNVFIFLVRLNNLHPRGLSLFIAGSGAAAPHPAVKAIPLPHEVVSTLAVGNCRCDLPMTDAGLSKSVKWELAPTLGHSGPKLIRRVHLASF
jgi:hypothetical protein